MHSAGTVPSLIDDILIIGECSMEPMHAGVDGQQSSTELRVGQEAKSNLIPMGIRSMEDKKPF